MKAWFKENFFTVLLIALTVALCAAVIAFPEDTWRTKDNTAAVNKVNFHYGWGYSVSTGKWGFDGGFGPTGINF